MEIPKPVKKIIQKEDKRVLYLNQWAVLFKEIREGIEVYLPTDENFIHRVREIVGDIDFGGMLEEAKILIILPAELKMTYIIGLPWDRMFSEWEVLADPLLEENYNYPCEPETKPWKYSYKEISEISNNVKREVPNPDGVKN